MGDKESVSANRQQARDQAQAIGNILLCIYVNYEYIYYVCVIYIIYVYIMCVCIEKLLKDLPNKSFHEKIESAYDASIKTHYFGFPSSETPKKGDVTDEE